jgi:hypothetical protein
VDAARTIAPARSVRATTTGGAPAARTIGAEAGPLIVPFAA